MLHSAVHLRHVEGSTLGIDENADGRKISEQAERVHRQENLRPMLIVSDNASVFKSTATWIKNIRKSERLQDYLAKQDISWRFNLSRSPWWGGIYESLIEDLKKPFTRHWAGRTSVLSTWRQ